MKSYYARPFYRIFTTSALLEVEWFYNRRTRQVFGGAARRELGAVTNLWGIGFLSTPMPGKITAVVGE